MKKILSISALITCFILYKLPRRALIELDPCLSLTALQDVNKTIQYAFNHYTDSKTIDHYMRQQFSFIKKSTYTHHSFKRCKVKLISHAPLFMIDDRWVMTDNNQCHQACLFDKDIVLSLAHIDTTSNTPTSACAGLTQLPTYIIQDYSVLLSGHWIIAYSNRCPYLKFIGAHPKDFDSTLQDFEHALLKESYIKIAINKKNHISVDTRFNNQYIVYQDT